MGKAPHTPDNGTCDNNNPVGSSVRGVPPRAPLEAGARRVCGAVRRRGAAPSAAARGKALGARVRVLGFRGVGVCGFGV